MNRRLSLLLLVLMLPGTAIAQPAAQPAAPPAADEPLPRWDTSGFIAWRGARIEQTGYNSSRWDARFVYGGTLGYYWTTNLKLEADLSATAPSDYDTYEPRTIDEVGYPLLIRTNHRTTTASFGGRVIYQFFDNVGFHPFVGAGAGVASIRERIDTERQSQVIRRNPDGTFETVVVSEAESAKDDRAEGFGEAIVGFKAYPTERLFFRSDVSWAAGRSRELTWRLGFGVDF